MVVLRSLLLLCPFLLSPDQTAHLPLLDHCPRRSLPNLPSPRLHSPDLSPRGEEMGTMAGWSRYRQFVRSLLRSFPSSSFTQKAVRPRLYRHFRFITAL